jgi:hypothetical protein
MHASPRGKERKKKGKNIDWIGHWLVSTDPSRMTFTRFTSTSTIQLCRVRTETEAGDGVEN